MKFNSLIKEIIKSRRLVAYFILSFGLAFLLYGIIAQRYYLSEGQIMPQMDIGGIMELTGALSGTMGQESKMMRVAKAAGLSLGYSSADVIGALLKSRTVMEAVINDCDLFTHYRIKPNSMEKALKQLRAVTSINITREDIIQIGCMATNPRLAAQIVNSYIDNLDEFLREKSMTKGKNMRLFLEKRLADAEIELKEAGDSLRYYQENNKIILPDEEIKVAIEEYAKLKATLISKEVESDIILNYSTKQDPYYISAKIESEAIKKKLAEIESSKEKNVGFGAGFGSSLSQTPSIIQEYYRLYLDVKIQEGVYGFLRQQYEQSRIMEIKDTPVITVLDWAQSPERKHSPRVGNMLIIGLILGLIIGIIKCTGSIMVSNVKQNPERWTLVAEIKDTLVHDFEGFLHLFKIEKGRKK